MHDGAESKRHGRGVNHRERLSPCQTCSLPYRGLTLSGLAGKLRVHTPTPSAVNCLSSERKEIPYDEWARDDREDRCAP